MEGKRATGTDLCTTERVRDEYKAVLLGRDGGRGSGTRHVGPGLDKKSAWSRTDTETDSHRFGTRTSVGLGVPWVSDVPPRSVPRRTGGHPACGRVISVSS